ncbi:alginate lyase family protein [Bradyrhizobium sp.]|uniref:heparinase II/III family protein n=1 Tax=Bradyrhizobium sp. TaxID=376 RepID=UPI0023901DED|nr:alginate lyase family protein [Bradyrhizobium sp.]MDE2376693.1 alginate lyase family protein [Bradyrhizobium sp.]
MLRYRGGNLARLVRTVRHLRARQVINRISRRVLRPAVARGPAPALRPPTTTWRNCDGRSASMSSPRRFRFLGQQAILQDAAGWNDPALPKLWLYNLHYFDDLRAQACADRAAWHRDLIDAWIADNPPVTGNGWEPYPMSLRIVNWIAWALAGNGLEPAVRDSLALQARALNGSLEYHLLGNHLLANAKALVFAGCYFSGQEAESWLHTGLDLLEREWREQILGDGGHFELSPMYHAILLEDVLDLVQLARIYPQAIAARSAAWPALAGRMLAWLGAMSHPDGDIAFFNDAAFGIARTHGQLSDYARWLNIPVEGNSPAVRLADSGYVRLESGPWLAIFDAAEVGPSYLPGHAHADTLSLEVTFGGHRLVTNSGTSTYAEGAVRNEERSTAAHATVEIDAESSSEVWAGFRVGRRAHPFDRSVSSAGEVQTASASHDGYRWLAGKPAHRREVRIDATSLIVRDTVMGEGNHAVVGRFPLHPLVSQARPDGRGWTVELPDKTVLRVMVKGDAECFLSEGYYAPSFGQRILRPVLAWRYTGRLPIGVETHFEL